MTIGDAIWQISQYVFTFAAIFSAAWVIADSKVSFKVRGEIALSRFWRVNEFLECPACTSFWMGVIVGWLVFGLRWIAIPFGFVACAISLILFLWVRKRA